MNDKRKLGVGVFGAHTWAEKAHLPGYAADPRVDLFGGRGVEIAGHRFIPFFFPTRALHACRTVTAEYSIHDM